MQKATIFDRLGRYESMNASRQEFLESLFQKFISVYQLETALDVGCGLGFFSHFLKKLGVKPTAVDARPENIEEAGRRYPEIPFLVHNVEDSRILELAPADLVLCLGLLYHLENPFRAIRHLQALTRKIMVVEAMIAPFSGPVAFLYDEPRGEEDQGLHYVAFIPSEQALVKMLYKAGFTAVYKPRQLPNHDQFRETRENKRMRTVLVASRMKIDLPGLSLVSEPATSNLWRKRTLLSFGKKALNWLFWQASQYTRRQRFRHWESQRRRFSAFVAKIKPGVKMKLYFDSRLAKLIYLENFEWLERQFLISFLKPGDIFVDVGANIGLFSLTAAYCLEKKGRVYAFEPFAKVHQRLLDNIKLNDFQNVSCYPVALSDKTGQARMTVSLDGYDAWNSLADLVPGEKIGVEQVGCVAWDDFAKEHDLIGRVTMMKIDVEGWERHVLEGARTTLAREDAPVLQVEFTDQTSLAAGSSCKELYRALERLGYQMFIYHPGLRRLIFDPIREEYPYVNLIAAKKTQFIHDRLAQSH